MIGRRWIVVLVVFAVAALALLIGIERSREQPRRKSVFSFERAAQVVADIPEVRSFMARNPTPFMMLDRSPTIERPVWTVYVGEDHPDHTVRWGTFEVNAMTGEVRADDSTGDSVPLSQWQWEQRLLYAR
jgi:hypothetical protein